MFAGLNLPIWKQEGALAFRLGISSMWVALFALGAFLRTCKNRRTAITLGGVACIAFAFTSTIAERKTYDQPRAGVAALRLHAASLRRFIPSESFVVAPHGSEFAVTYVLGRRSSRVPPRTLSAVDIFSFELAEAPRGCLDLATAAEIPEQTTCVQLSNDAFLTRMAHP